MSLRSASPCARDRWPCVRSLCINRSACGCGLEHDGTLLLFALLELQARRAGLSMSGQALLAQAAPLAVVRLLLSDGTTLRRLANLGPPVADLLPRLDWPAAECYG